MALLKSKGFILRHFRMSDVKAYFNSQQDKQARMGFMSTPKSLAEAKKEVREAIAEYKKKKPHFESFAIEVDGKFAGFIAIHDLFEKYVEHIGKLSYCIHPDFRNKGLATKAVKAITSYAFKKYKLKRFWAWCRTYNKASARVLEKAGFKLEGIMRKNKFKDGKYLDDMVWAIVR